MSVCNILVTGAGGYVGSWLAGRRDTESDSIRLIPAARGDFSYQEPDSIRRFFAGREIHQVIHLAAVCETEDAGDYYRTNLCGLYNLLCICRECSVRHFTFISGNNVYPADSLAPHREDEECRPDYRNYYGISKYAGELLVKDMLAADGMSYCILRIGDIYGPGQRYGNLLKALTAAGARKDVLRLYGEGARTRDYIYIQDAADGIYFAASRELQGIYNLATGTGTSVSGLVELVWELSGGGCRVEQTACDAEDKSCVVLNVEKLRRAGFRPSVSLRDGLRIMLEREKESL